MSYISSIPREHLMMSNSIDGCVSRDNIVHFIDAFVDREIKANINLFEKGKSTKGRPCYTPNCLSKLLIYGYLNSISSSRMLERESKRNLEVIWLMHNLHPDHWTISDFRKENKELIRRITIDFRKFLKDSDYIKDKSISTDGTKIKAYASRDTLSVKLIEKKLEKAEKEIERYFAQMDTNDTTDNEYETMYETSEELKKQISFLQSLVEELKSQKSLLETLEVNSLVPVDPQAKVMKTKDGFLPCYNVQTTADNDSHFITSCEVTDYPNDYHSLQENVNAVEEQLDFVPEEVLADGGYANEEDMQSLESKGIEVIVPFADEPEAKKVQRDNGITFRYDEENDCFKCSQGKILLLAGKNCERRNHLYNRYQCRECSCCPVKQHCTTSKVGRIIYKRIHGEWLENYKKKMQTADFKKKFKRRKCVIEHPYGTMKYYMGQIPILLRGREKVQIEMDLYSTAYNLKHLSNATTVSVLLEKLANWMPKAVFSLLSRCSQQFLPKEKAFCSSICQKCSY
jgi:transposase